MDSGIRVPAGRHNDGGIFGLLELLDEHGEAIEADLLSNHRHRNDIGTPGFSWHDFRIFVNWLDTRSALYRSKYPRSWPWTVDTELLSAILLALQGANWQRSGGRGERPKLIKRPTDGISTEFDTSISTAERKKAQDDELARRRAARARRGRRRQKIIPRAG